MSGYCAEPEAHRVPFIPQNKFMRQVLSESLTTGGDTEVHSQWVSIRAGIQGLSLRVPALNHHTTGSPMS